MGRNLKTNPLSLPVNGVYTYTSHKYMCLRVRAVFIRLLRSAMFMATLNLVAFVGLTLFFGKLKDCSLLINILATNMCFC